MPVSSIGPHSAIQAATGFFINLASVMSIRSVLCLVCILTFPVKRPHIAIFETEKHG